MPKGMPKKRYAPAFKKIVIETMLMEKLSYSETARRDSKSVIITTSRIGRRSI